MEEKIKQELRLKKISEMKFPVILMSEYDFINFQKLAVNKTFVSDYDGIPIRINRIVEVNTIIIFDNCFDSWYDKPLIDNDWHVSSEISFEKNNYII